MPKTVLLMGAAGSGKSLMAYTTAVKQPVHVIDFDRKVKNMEMIQSFIKEGKLTAWEVDEAVSEESLSSRARALAKNEKPSILPKGWVKFADYVDQLPKKEESLKAGTWVIDSWTLATDHLVSFILANSAKAHAFMNQREWGAYLQMNKEAITGLCDIAKTYDKDLIIICHTKVVAKPEPSAIIMYNSDGERTITGRVKEITVPSVQGQFGEIMPRYFEEVYGLEIKIVNGKPTWICRVKSDDERNLRTSFNLAKEEFECDFRKIWR